MTHAKIGLLGSALLLAGCAHEPMGAEEFAELVDLSLDELRVKQEACTKEFRLGTYERFDWDQKTGQLVFSDGGTPRVVADIHFIGSISTKSGTWLWAWDNETVLDHLKDRVSRVRDFGAEHDIPELINPRWPAQQEEGWEMTAVAAHLLQAKGAYRTPDDDGFTFMVFTDIRWADPPAQPK